MSDEDIETSEYQFGERAEDYGDDDDVVESTTGDIDDDDDVDGDNDGNSTDEDEPEDDESAEDGDAAAPSAAPSIGMITDLESCLVTQVAKRWSVYDEEAKVYEVVKVASGLSKKRKGGLFGRAKSEEGEERIVVVGKYRVWVFTRVAKKKVTELAEFHIFGIASLTYEEKTRRIAFTLKTALEKPVSLDFYCGAESRVFAGIVESYHAMTVGFPDNYVNVRVTDGAVPARPPAPASAYEAFAANYVGQCSYLKMPVNREILAYVEHQLGRGSDTLDLTSVPAIAAAGAAGDEKAPSVAYAAVLTALMYDTHFRAVVVSHTPHAATLRTLGKVLARNTHVTKVVATHAAAGDVELAAALGALAGNAATNVQVLDLSGNAFGPKSAQALAAWLASAQRAVRTLVLRDCGLHARLLQGLFRALAANPGMSLTIEHLDLSGNRLEAAGTQALDQWFNQLKAYARLRVLRLRNTALALNALPSLRLLAEVEELDVSQNRVDAAAMGVLCQFVDATPTLRRVALDGCMLTPDTFRMFATSLLNNPKRIVLDLSLVDNPELGKTLGRDLAGLAGHVSALSLAGYRFREAQLVDVIDGLAGITGLARVRLGGACDGKVRGAQAVADALCRLVAGSGTLEELDIADGFGPAVVTALLSSTRPGRTIIVSSGLAPETCALRRLDISGNALGDAGAAAVARWLARNSTLTALAMDANHVRTNGLLALATAFAANSTLRALRIDADVHREYSALAAEPDRRRLLDAVLRIDLALHARTAYDPWVPASDSTVADVPAPTTDATLPAAPLIFQQSPTSGSTTTGSSGGAGSGHLAGAPAGEDGAQALAEPASAAAAAETAAVRARLERDYNDAEKMLRTTHKPIIASRVRGGGASSSGGASSDSTPEPQSPREPPRLTTPPKLTTPPTLAVPPGMQKAGTRTPQAQGQGQQASPSPTPAGTGTGTQRKSALTARRAAPARRTAPSGPSMTPTLPARRGETTAATTFDPTTELRSPTTAAASPATPAAAPATPARRELPPKPVRKVDAPAAPAPAPVEEKKEEKEEEEKPVVEEEEEKKPVEDEPAKEEEAKKEKKEKKDKKDKKDKEKKHKHKDKKDKDDKEHKHHHKKHKKDADDASTDAGTEDQ